MTFTQYTGWQWLLIDAANQYGHDKKLFEERIQWAEDNLHQLEALTDEAETKPLYIKAVMAIRKAQKGIPTGHLVGVDASCSGIQIMSAMTGCIAGATNTGLVDPNVRADAYSQCTKFMNEILGGAFTIVRKWAKDALMTAFYASIKRPKEIFGEDTPELNAFYQAAMKVAPGAWELLQDLKDIWQPYALAHAWKLPDGYDAVVKVMVEKSARIEVDELDHATFTYEYKVNEGEKKGISLPANVTHSMDAFVLREMHRRCNYDRPVAERAAEVLQAELMMRHLDYSDTSVELDEIAFNKINYYIEQYNRSGLAAAVILPYIDANTVKLMSTEHIEKVWGIVQGMLRYQPFELITVHDEFKSHPNHINHVRTQYKTILAEIAESHVLDDILSQICGQPVKFARPSNNLGELIRGSAYALT